MKITKKMLNNSKKVVLQVAIKLSYARHKGIIKNEADEFMFIVAETITEWEKIKSGKSKMYCVNYKRS